VPTFDERLAYLEGRVEEHSRNVDGIRDALVSLERRTDARFDGLERRTDARFDSLERRVDTRLDGVDRRLDAVERRFNVMDVKIDLTRDALDQKMSRHFLWLVGIQVTTLVAILGALLAR